jgi:hypothetical protein
VETVAPTGGIGSDGLEGAGDGNDQNVVAVSGGEVADDVFSNVDSGQPCKPRGLECEALCMRRGIKIRRSYRHLFLLRGRG